MNSRFMCYSFFLSIIALLMMFYSAFRNGFLPWKTDNSFFYLNFRSKISNSFRSTNNNHNFEAKSTVAEQNMNTFHSNFISNIPYTEYGNASQCPQNIFKNNLTKLLETWCNIAERNKISWTLFYGSLLGTLRNNDIIPYDSDIDILVDASDVAKLRRLEHPRNFVNKDYKTRLVLVPDFGEPVQDRRHITCEGKVRRVG